MYAILLVYVYYSPGVCILFYSHEDSNGILEDTNGIHEDTNGIHEDTNGMREHINGIHEDTNGIHEDTNGMQEDTNGMQEDTNGMLEDTNGMHEDTNAVQEMLEKTSFCLVKFLKMTKPSACIVAKKCKFCSGVLYSSETFSETQRYRQKSRDKKISKISE